MANMFISELAKCRECGFTRIVGEDCTMCQLMDETADIADD